MPARKLWAVGGVVFTMLLGTAPALADSAPLKVTICHGSSAGYELITVDQHALNGHFDGSGPAHGWQNLPDKFPEADGTCVGGGGGGEF